MAELSRVYFLFSPKGDVSKEPKDSILFQIAPVNNQNFVRDIQSLRHQKKFKLADLRRETKKLKGLMTNYAQELKGAKKSTPKDGYRAFPKVSDETIDEGRRLSDWINSVISKEEISNLMQKHDISQSWYWPIWDYFLTGRMSRPSFNFRIVYDEQQVRDKGFFWLEFDGDTDLRDILNGQTWKLIEGYKAYLILGNDSQKKRHKSHTSLHIESDSQKVRLSIYADTTQATLKSYWKKLRIAKVQASVSGRGFKGRKGLGYDSVNLLEGKNTIPDDVAGREKKRGYEWRLRKRGLKLPNN